MKRIAVLTLFISVVASACQGSATPEALLVIVDGEGSVSVITADGSVIAEITATPEQRHFQPIWIDRTTIAYATNEEEAHRLTSVNLDAEEQWTVEHATPVFFALPSPDGERIATLRSSGDGSPIVAEVWSPAEGTHRVGNEAPFYMAWAPDGGALAAHIRTTRLATIEPEVVVMETSTGPYQAPYWSSAGIVGLRTVGNEQRLAVWSEGESRDIASVRGPVRFVGVGNTLAIAAGETTATGERALAQSLPRIPAGQLSVLDVVSGSITVVATGPTPIFQWNRTGNRLLFATVTPDPVPQLRWHVWEDGATTDYEAFTPDPSWIAEFVPFFDQYAPTTALWSPDGNVFAYPAVVDGRSTVMIQDVDMRHAVELTSGSWVSWSP